MLKKRTVKTTLEVTCRRASHPDMYTIQKLLESGEPGGGSNERVFVQTYLMGGQYEIDVIVYDTPPDSTPWVDATLFHKGSEVHPTEVGESLWGEYHFQDGEQEFLLILKPEERKDMANTELDKFAKLADELAATMGDTPLPFLGTPDLAEDSGGFQQELDILAQLQCFTLNTIEGALQARHKVVEAEIENPTEESDLEALRDELDCVFTIGGMAEAAHEDKHRKLVDDMLGDKEGDGYTAALSKGLKEAFSVPTTNTIADVMEGLDDDEEIASIVKVLEEKLGVNVHSLMVGPDDTPESVAERIVKDLGIGGNNA